MFIQKIRPFATSVAIAFSLFGSAFAATPRFAYVPNIDDGTISEFVVNSSTGQLLPNGYVTAGDHPRSLVNVGNFVYVTNMNSGDISAYSLSQSTGQLAPLSTPSYLAPGNPYAIIAHPNGKFLYVVDSLGGSVYVYQIATDGSLHQLSTMTAGTNPRFLAITGSGSFLYAANFGSNNVTAYKVNSTTGLLTTAGTYATGIKPSNVMASGSKFLYVTNAGTNNVSAFSINSTTGALGHVSGSPFAAGTSPYSLTREYFGNFIYVGNSISNNISVYKVNQTTGALAHVSGSPFAATKGTQALKIDPSNKFLYAADAGAEEVMVYAMNLSTGALINTSSIRTHGIGFDINVTNGSALVSKPAFAYFLVQTFSPQDPNCPPNCPAPLYTYSIDPTTGSLNYFSTNVTDLQEGLSSTTDGFYFYDFGEPFDSERGGPVIYKSSSNPGPLIEEEDDSIPVFDYQNRFEFTSSGGLTCYLFYPCLDGYAIDAQSGNLSQLPYQNLGDPVGFDLSGKFLYGHDSFGTFTIFKVDPSTGSLTFSTQATNASYVPGTMHPSGRFLYAPTAGGVLAVGMNVSTGVLSTLSFSPGPSVNPMIENMGKFAYLPITGGLGIYKIDQTTGKLTRVATTPNTGTMDASGNFLMGYSNSNGIQAWACKINHTTGAVSAPVSHINLPTSFTADGMSYQVTDYSRATTRVVN